MEIQWKHYSEIKMLAERYGIAEGSHERHDAFLRELLDILGL